MKLKLIYPVQGYVSQNFGGNGNSLYAESGLWGHPGVDIVADYNSPIIDAVTGYNKKYIYSLLNEGSPDPMKYRAVCTIVEADDGVFEVIYGHCNNINCKITDHLVGQQIATEGNTGSVYVGGRLITAQEKLSGSHAGAHVHFQVRRLKKTKLSTMRAITYDGVHDFVDPQGFHFDVPNYDNGYNGCIDPLQFIGPQYNYQFYRDLELGSWGTDVYQLQKRLIRLGFGSFTPLYVFGPKTKQAVMALQEAYGLEPVGRVGPKTRLTLNL